MENKQVKFRYGNDFDTQSNTSPGAIYFDFKKKQIWADSPTEENHTLFTLNKLSELEEDANHNTVSTTEKEHWNQKADSSTVEELALNVSYIDEEDNETIISDIEAAKKQLKDYIDTELTEAKANGEFDGKSAYSYAVDGGYTGTEEEFYTELANYTNLDSRIGEHNEADNAHQDIRDLIDNIDISSDIDDHNTNENAHQDIRELIENFEVSASSVNGIFPIEKGGTGASTVEEALQNLGIFDFINSLSYSKIESGHYNGTSTAKLSLTFSFVPKVIFIFGNFISAYSSKMLRSMGMISVDMRQLIGIHYYSSSSSSDMTRQMVGANYSYGQNNYSVESVDTTVNLISPNANANNPVYIFNRKQTNSDQWTDENGGYWYYAFG